MTDEQAEKIIDAMNTLNKSIHPTGCVGEDASGTTVSSLTEAIGGMTAGLCCIADAIESLAEAVRESKTSEGD